MRAAWGKTNQASEETHLLVHHCADVAAVFEGLLTRTHYRRVAERLAARQLGSVDIARLTALAFCHDVGKLHPDFQKKGWPGCTGGGASHLVAGYEIMNSAARNTDHPLHSVVGALSGWTSPPHAEFDVILAHHGTRVAPPDGARRPWPMLDQYDWREETQHFAKRLMAWLPEAFSDGPVLPDRPEFHHFIAGLLALADWIGSDSGFFPFQAARDGGYPDVARQRAARALSEIGFDQLPLVRPDFGALTGFAQPNAAQEAVGAAPLDDNLVLLEAETGSGKTEAALLRFVHLLAAGKVDGMYFAVPTRAAARQLHGRVQVAVSRFFGSAAPQVVLAIPGMLQAGEAQGWRAPGWEVRWDDQPKGRARWAAEHATRYLAARVAVGTVDQAMLSALSVKHAHARGSALSRTLLVIDEVHASDTYMERILHLLVEQHRASGGHAMLMSATLGTRARVAWTGGELPDHAASVALPYPAVWSGGRLVAPKGAGNPKRVAAELLPDWDARRYADLAISAARKGARALVVRNTVDEAVKCFQAVRDAGAESLLMQVGGQCALHHSRFAAEDRGLLDAAVEQALVPRPDRAAGGVIVIGTQTLEQSLDICADLLITDLCPMDVLLQRVGRLHRNALIPRPTGFEQARVLVGQPEGGLDRLAQPNFENGLGAWESNGWNGIYTDLAAVELTRRMIGAPGIWGIPAMNRMLVEGATHPEPVAALIAEKGPIWSAYQQKERGTNAARGMMAQLVVLNRSGRFDRTPIPGDDETIMTRLGEEGAIITLPEGTIGAFGKPVSRITLPAHWSKGNMEDEGRLEGGVLTIGDRVFGYGVEGLRQGKT